MLMFLVVVQIVMIVLKLTKKVELSWWIVMLPLISLLVLIVVDIVTILFTVGFITTLM